jgi:hypothetical protein
MTTKMRMTTTDHTVIVASRDHRSATTHCRVMGNGGPAKATMLSDLAKRKRRAARRLNMSEGIAGRQGGPYDAARAARDQYLFSFKQSHRSDLEPSACTSAHPPGPISDGAHPAALLVSMTRRADAAGRASKTLGCCPASERRMPWLTGRPNAE